LDYRRNKTDRRYKRSIKSDEKIVGLHLVQFSQTKMAVLSTPVSPKSVVEFPSPVLSGTRTAGAAPSAAWTGRHIDDLFGLPFGEFEVPMPPQAPLRREDSAVFDGEILRVLAQEFEILQQGVRNLGAQFDAASTRIAEATANSRSAHVRCIKCKINRVPFYNRDDEEPRCYDCDGKLRNELMNLKTSMQF
jgi:hypothetical protein